MLTHGAKFSDFGNPAVALAFQQFVIRFQTQLEDHFCNYAASTGQPSVVLCDRGVMDGGAYMQKDDFVQLLTDENTNIIAARDWRYDAVIHLLTAADGAAEYYSLDNNPARSETPEQAIERDRSSQRTWVGHPYHVFIDNSYGSFEAKLSVLEMHLAKLLFIGTDTHVASFPHKVTLAAPLSLPQDAATESFEATTVSLLLAPITHLLQRDFPLVLEQWMIVSIELAVRSSGPLQSYWIAFFLRDRSHEQRKSNVYRKIPMAAYREYIASENTSVARKYTRSTCFIAQYRHFQLIEYLRSGDDKAMKGNSELLCLSDSADISENLASHVQSCMSHAILL